MNKEVLKTGVQSFIEKNWNTDIVSVMLKKPIFDTISQQELAQQLEGKKKAKNKLPTWFGSTGIYYPKKVHLEQTSSEATAEYKANLISGKALIDITGGFGVDSHYFSKKIDTVIHCEINKALAEIVAHNSAILGSENIKVHYGDGLKFINGYAGKIDWVYADPSRRDAKKQRVFLLGDCIPDIVGNLGSIFEKTPNVLLKTSPLLDISKGLQELKHVVEIHVVAVKNEVKELLWVMNKGHGEEPRIIAVNLTGSGVQHFSFLPSEEKDAVANLALPDEFLYEPNAAILKAGAFKAVGKRFNLQKLHEHSHLYTSTSPIDFPGRCFKVQSVLPYEKKALQQAGLNKANVTVRNFMESVAAIRKKHKIKDGGDTFLFFTTNMHGKLVVLKCTKI